MKAGNVWVCERCGWMGEIPAEHGWRAGGRSVIVRGCRACGAEFEREEGDEDDGE